MLAKRAGFTVMELIAAMTIVSIVILLLFGTFTFTNRFYIRNAEYSELQHYAMNFMRSLEKNLFNAAEILSVAENEIVIKKRQGPVGRYRWDGENLYYNNKVLGRDRFKITGFNIEAIGKGNNDLTSADNFISIHELDKNGDSRVESRELGELKMVKVSVDYKNKAVSQEYVIFVKNRVNLLF